MVKLSTSSMRYNSGFGGSFVTEVSDLQLCSGPPDAFELESHKTGAKILCRIFNVERDREGDVTFWEYVSNDPNYPFTVTIFND